MSDMNEISDKVYEAFKSVMTADNVIDVYPGSKPLTVEVVVIMTLTAMIVYRITFIPIIAILEAQGIYVTVDQVDGTGDDQTEPYMMAQFTMTVATTRPNLLS